MNLVLDLDNTLVHEFEARPHLIPFLKYCMRKFISVSIWTAGSRAWWDVMYGAHMHKHNIRFDFVFTQEHCVIYKHGSVVLKPLSLLWNNEQYPHTRENTIIIDDTPTTAAWNPDNLLAINRYFGGPDIELQLMCLRLKDIVKLYRQVNDVTKIDINMSPPYLKIQ